MKTRIYPQAIQNLLSAVQEYEGTDLWSDVLNHSTSVRDKELTSVLCCSDGFDFVAMDEDDAFLFTCNDQTGAWTVEHVGKPVYYVEQEMLGRDDFDLDEFIVEMQNELPGVKIKRGWALTNHRSDFVRAFKDEIDRAFQRTLINFV